MLLAHGASILTKDRTTNENCVHLAINTGDLETVKEVLDNAKWAGIENRNETDFDMNEDSVPAKINPILQNLLEERNNKGLTPLALAANNYLNHWNLRSTEHVENDQVHQFNQIIDELIGKGANISHEDSIFRYEKPESN